MSREIDPQAKTMLEGKVRIRSASITDVNFIFNSWLKSYRLSKNSDSIINEIYFTHHHKLLEGLLKSCPTLVLCNNDDPTQIYGYICSEVQQEVPVLHFIYIKEVYRNLGLAKTLLEAAKIDVTKPFFYTQRLRSSKYFEEKYPIIHNPYLAYYGYSLIVKEESEAASVKRG